MLEIWSEMDLVTGLIIGEAAGEPWAGKVGVGLTARTRVLHPGRWGWGRNWREVILSPAKFSCWWDIKNLNRIIEHHDTQSEIWQECQLIAEQVYFGRIKSSLGNPDHYHRHDCDPSWDDDMKILGRIGDHVFYDSMSK